MTGVMEILGFTLLFATTFIAGLKQTPTVEVAAPWIFCEASGTGFVTADQSVSMMQTNSLILASEASNERLRYLRVSRNYLRILVIVCTGQPIPDNYF